MANRVIDFQGKLDISQILSALSSIESKVKSSNTTDVFQRKYLTMIENLKKQAESLSQRMQQGFSNTTELDKFVGKMETMQRELTGLTNTLSSSKVGIKDIANISPEDLNKIKQLDQKIKEIRSNLKATKKETQLSVSLNAPKQSEVGIPVGDLKTALASNIDDQEAINKLFDQGFLNLQKQEEEVQKQVQANEQLLAQQRELNSLLDKKGRLSKEDRATIQASTKTDISKMNKAEVRDTLAEDTKKLEDHQRLLEVGTQKIQTYKTNLEGWKQSTLELSSSITQKTQEASTSIDKMGKEISEVYENYSKTETADFRNLAEGSRKAENALNGMEDGAKRTGREVKTLEERSRFFDNLGSKVAMVFSLNKAFMLLNRALRVAWTEIKELDSEFTGIAVVTDKTTKDLWETFSTYNQIARELGTTTKEAVETSKLYYQQGLETQEVMTLTEETIKMAKIAGLDFATATNEMTAAIRGFKLEMSDASRVNDIFSALAAEAAVDTQEVAYALTKTASIAQSAGLTLESTSAFLTQMIETTREAPEQNCII